MWEAGPVERLEAAPQPAVRAAYDRAAALISDAPREDSGGVLRVPGVRAV